ncbi:unnamed protein product [Acanthoscelides obtectus]|uniref:Uncharacterized protein n=1 Tax=Acanthoscelides obtectus TaxID=200917 RepID=A0A9P0M8D1_ACAOB|nr:unnamed protein product [Acanthoscelides obtectus]CAK1641247.1 hypothetical protein AOBTE_LOCUS12268 [Acanthoscelides obtectus]
MLVVFVCFSIQCCCGRLPTKKALITFQQPVLKKKQSPKKHLEVQDQY